VYIFPAHLFNPTSVRAGVMPTVISGGTAISGDETVIQTDGGGRWRVEYSDIDIDDPALERLWDQWVSYLSGGARAVLVPLLSLATAPRPYVGAPDADPSDLFWDDDAFPSFVQFASPHILANTVYYAPVRATTLTIDVKQGSRLRGGEKLSVDGRAYLIERVISRSDFLPGDGQRAECVISPPLRREIVNPASLNFDWPLVQCRAEIGQSLIPDMELGMFSTTSISFVEDFSNAN
jgi:hypothetical protein